MTVRFLHRQPPGSTGGTNVFSDVHYTPGRWHHVAAVKREPALTLYLDGNPVGSADDPTLFQSPPGRLVVGKLGVDPLEHTRYFSGQIDEVAVYNRALSEKEVKQHYELTR